LSALEAIHLASKHYYLIEKLVGEDSVLSSLLLGLEDIHLASKAHRNHFFGAFIISYGTLILDFYLRQEHSIQPLDESFDLVHN